jgi:2-polyprenyl-6-hydroxyphenyl methylase/3-demethylubiquinone-9 3-methyltransferase
MNVVEAEREVTERFDAVESRFRAAVGGDDVRLSALRRTLGPVRGKRALDLGCGKGRFARHLVADGAIVTCVDRSAAMLASARGLDRVRASCRHLPFADATFDAVIAVEVLEHVPDVRGAIAAMVRACRPGGTIAVIDKNAFALDAVRPWLPSSLVKWRDERLGRWMYPPDSPVRERWFRPRAMASLLEAAGLKSVRVSHLLRPEEARWEVFRHLPTTRLWVLWTARRPGDGASCA